MSYARKEQVEVVVVTSRFPLYLRGTPYNNGEGGLEKRDPVYFDLIETKAGTGDDRQRQNRVENGFEERIRSLASEFKVVLVYPIPEAGWDVPITASRNAWFSGREPQLSTDFGAYKKRTAEVNALFDRLTVELPNVYGARVYQALCSEKTARCVNADENGIYYHDDDHLSKSGARRVAPIIVDAVKKALQQGEESRMADQ